MVMAGCWNWGADTDMLAMPYIPLGPIWAI
jgi:hypothetical protein